MEKDDLGVVELFGFCFVLSVCLHSPETSCSSWGYTVHLWTSFCQLLPSKRDQRELWRSCSSIGGTYDMDQMGCDWCTRMDATVHQQDTPCRTQSLISPATGCVSQGGSTVESFPRNFHLPTGTVSSKGSPHLNICWFRGSKVWPPCRISGLKFSAPLQLAKALSATVSLFSFFLLSILAFSFSHRKWKWSRSIVSDSLQPYGLPYSSIHTIFQARVLEWVAISFSRGSSRPRDPTQGSNPGLPHCRQTLYHLSHQGSPNCCQKQLHTNFYLGICFLKNPTKAKMWGPHTIQFVLQFYL